ncbi:MAG: hypothetical protein C0478_10600 [Planctomyces sp.]|nr:hypothetical protein [Planctomyces sp.]
MSIGEGWRNLFENWPETIPRNGILVTTHNDTIPFKAFLISGSILLVERETPDSQGARKIMIAYDCITAVKITSPLDLPRFMVMGFQPPM